MDEIAIVIPHIGSFLDEMVMVLPNLGRNSDDLRESVSANSRHPGDAPRKVGSDPDPAGGTSPKVLHPQIDVFLSLKFRRGVFG